VAALMASMVIPARDHGAAGLTTPDTLVAPAKTKDKGAKAKAKKPVKAKLTAKQLAARASAVTVLRNQGYLPTREADFNPRHELRVLIGYRNGDPLGPRRAYFFVGQRMIGNDASGGSSTLKLAKSGNRSATLAYGVYAPGGKDPISTTKVRFDWNGTSLTPAGSIPLGRVATG
jgi:hypothetical protein